MDTALQAFIGISDISGDDVDELEHNWSDVAARSRRFSFEIYQVLQFAAEYLFVISFFLGLLWYFKFDTEGNDLILCVVGQASGAGLVDDDGYERVRQSCIVRKFLTTLPPPFFSFDISFFFKKKRKNNDALRICAPVC